MLPFCSWYGSQLVPFNSYLLCNWPVTIINIYKPNMSFGHFGVWILPRISQKGPPPHRIPVHPGYRGKKRFQPGPGTKAPSVASKAEGYVLCPFLPATWALIVANHLMLRHLEVFFLNVFLKGSCGGGSRGGSSSSSSRSFNKMCASFIEWKLMASAPAKAHMEPEHDGWLWGIYDQTKMADVASRCCFHNISTGSSTLRILIEFSASFPTFNGPTVEVHRSTMSCFICVKPCSLGKFIDWFRGRSCLPLNGGYHVVIYVIKSVLLWLSDTPSPLYNHEPSL